MAKTYICEIVALLGTVSIIQYDGTVYEGLGSSSQICHNLTTP